MTTYYPIAYTVPQYEDANGNPYSGAVLKAYRAGTTTNIPFATGSDGVTTATSIALNANGNPEVSGSVVIPYLSEDYKLSLYPSQSAADSNTGAVWTVDELPLSGNANAVRYLGYSADTGSADAYILSPSPAISAYETGMVVTLKPTNANTGASTLSVSGLSAKDIKDANGNAISAGQLNTSGIFQLTYNGTYFVLGDVNGNFANKPLTSTVNWNTGVLTPGFYITSGTTYAGTLPLGSSTEHTGSLDVKGNGNDLYQTWRNGLVSQQWQRMTTDGGSNWTAWREMTNQSAYSTTTAIDTLTNADSGITQELTGSTSRTWTLPAAGTCGTGFYFTAKNSGSGSALLTIARAGSDTIDGQTSLTLAKGETRLIYCTGATTFASVLLSGAFKGYSLASYNTNADLATAMPIDDTAPTDTEGAEFLSVTVTPSGHAATNTRHLVIVTGNLSAAAAVQGISLFGGSSPINAMSVSAVGATSIQGFALQGSLSTTGTSPIVFSARIGNAAGNAVRLNGTASARHFGALQAAKMVVLTFEDGV